MAVLGHLVGGLATHDVHQMPGSKTHATHLVDAVNRRQQFASRVGAVPNGGRVQAVVAIAAGLTGFAKVTQQTHATAVGGLGQTQQRVELAAHHLLEFFASRALVNHAALVHDILQTIGHPRVGSEAVAAGAACLLVVALDVLGHVAVGHKANIRLVDAHAKGNGGHHHDAFFAQKPVLMELAYLGIQARVVRQGLDARIYQGLGHVFHLLAALAVDDASLALVFPLNEAQQLGGGVLLFDDGVADVGAVKAADKGASVFELQPLQDVSACQVVRGGRECNARNAWVTLVQDCEVAVVGAEVVAPLAHAVGFVNCEQAELAALEQRIQQGQKPCIANPLGRGIQQRDLSPQQLLLNLVGLVATERGVEEGGTDTRLV